MTLKNCAKFPVLAALGMLLVLTGCAETQLASHYAKQLPWPGSEDPKGSYKVGKPYNVAGTWYYPKEDYRLIETGIASWYGPDFHGKKTANGEIYDQNELTAAHRTLPMPSLVRVTNLENGRAVVVRINDRGPFSKSRVIDLSRRAAELLNMVGRGTAQVRVEVLERESRLIAEAARRGADTGRLTLSDLEKFDVAPSTRAPSVQTAAIAAPAVRNSGYSGSNIYDDLPESLKTPTITVEELHKGGRPTVIAAAPSQPPISGHMSKGRFMPDPIVTNVPVPKTGIFVQAGSFGVKDNADRLAAQLKKYGGVIVDPVTVGGKTMYRVKVGPMKSVSEADAVLAKVSRETGGAKVIKQN